MIKTLIPIKIPKNLIRDDYLKLSSYNNTWKCIDEDTNHITIDCILINELNKTNDLANDIDWKIINNNYYHELPPPNWLLIKLKELTYVLIDDILIYGGMSMPFCNWIINDINKKNLIIIQLDNINSNINTIIYNVKIITLECLSSLYPDYVYEIKILI